ncbi:EamA-like transporter family protein [Clostridium amylolyticum]|uniref:EamA-like transporter family protein n=1 Tax=Clostridium amylolyticum TaxID=1121298 RepID=A0A1M6GFK9_9CLOT|nr:EamA family transporter [Clostridium amylolyticum]SHJ08756.1 EamA-like transporter family protein [Clostridium amylolyticum]
MFKDNIVKKKRLNTIMDIAMLQAIIVIYTTTGIFAKKASSYDVLSKEFILYYGLEIFILGIYAILWQQIIKKFQLSVAYVNRAVALLWSLLWSVIFFKEAITLNNILGAAIIIIGIAVVNSDD